MFETTRWSLVAAAGSEDSAACRAALAALRETYWYSLYAFVRRRGADPDDARDLTQGFLTSLLDRHHFDDLRKDRGRVRAFLLASFKNFLAKDAARRHRLKRGGATTILSLSPAAAEGRYRFEPAEPSTPETLCERRWALTVIDRVLARLRQEWEAKARAAEFDELKACLLGEVADGGYAAIAVRLGLTETAVRVSVHRLKKNLEIRRWRSVLRALIGWLPMMVWIRLILIANLNPGQLTWIWGWRGVSLAFIPLIAEAIWAIAKETSINNG